MKNTKQSTQTETDNNVPGALEGVRVLELGQLIAGRSADNCWLIWAPK